ncbi:hypothetical protein MTO96_032735 [Rhipicephalus appendiculatus]
MKIRNKIMHRPTSEALNLSSQLSALPLSTLPSSPSLDPAAFEEEDSGVRCWSPDTLELVLGSSDLSFEDDASSAPSKRSLHTAVLR